MSALATSLRRRGTLLALGLLTAALAACAPQAPEAVPPPPPPPAPQAPPSATAAKPPAPAEAPPWNHDWARGAVFYEVFVRSFQDTDGDGIGDLRGLISRLDYLKDLGVEGLWLMPMFKSPSYHGYDTVDYETIQPAYGTNADFDALVREAHARGIRVLLDLVINHTGRDHPWFVDAAASPGAPKRGWYLWRQDDPGWTQPWGGDRHTWHEKNGAYYYGLFSEGMPDLNLQNPAVRAEVQRIARLWLDRGADGFRLDAARHLIESGPGQGQCDSAETHAFWKDLSAFVRRARPEAMLVGESWTETSLIASYYGATDRVRGGDELPMTFDFPLAEALLAGAKAGDAAPIAKKLDEIQRVYAPGVLDATFLTNHDQQRVATQLGNDAAKLKSAAAVLLTLPGTPFLYYGEELGMQNGPDRDDKHKRMPMAWDGSPKGGFTTGEPWFQLPPGYQKANVASASKDPRSLLSRYRELIRLRRGSKALREGALQLLTPATGGSTPVLAFLREAREVRDVGDARAPSAEKLLVVHNLGDKTAEAGPYVFPGELAEVIATEKVRVRKGPDGARLTLAGHATAVFRLK